MTPRFRDSALVLIVSGLIVVCLYLASAILVRLDGPSLALSPETERLREELVKLSSDLDASTLEGRACRTGLAGLLYELRKDSVRTRVILAERVERQVLERTLFAATLGFGIAALILGVALTASAARRQAAGGDADGTAGGARTGWTGIAALAASVVAFGVLALLPDPPRTAPVAAAPLALDMAAFVDQCEDFRQKED